MKHNFKYLNKLDIDLKSDTDLTSLSNYITTNFDSLQLSGKLHYNINYLENNRVEFLLFTNDSSIDWINIMSMELSIETIILTHLPFCSETKDDLKIIKYLNGGKVDFSVYEFGSSEYHELVKEFFKQNLFKIDSKLFKTSNLAIKSLLN